PEENVLEKGRLGPGQMIAVDLNTQEILKNWEIKQRIAKQYPYGEWLQKYRLELNRLVKGESNGNGNGHHSLNGNGQTSRKIDTQVLLQQQIAFGYTIEDVEMVIHPMASTGAEATFCMGD
ncbi:MAG: glutamate synthase central domain-containing protein, partial [Dolichospermum sp.]